MQKIIFRLFVVFLPFTVLGQTENEVTQKLQTWVSINTVTKFSDHWGVIVDAHIRSEDFVGENNFYFIRGGLTYIPKNLISLTAGYAHMWLAPSNPDWTTYSDENRFYQQVLLNTTVGNVGMTQRIRNEQRWQEKIIDDQESDQVRFTNRIRYLLGFNIPIFKKKTLPLLVVSDEILMHFGSEVVYNTFEQNRFFVGIKQQIDPKWSFDFGYMNVYQQKYSGYQYDMNHTIRLFFYLTTSINKKTPSDLIYYGDE